MGGSRSGASDTCLGLVVDGVECAWDAVVRPTSPPKTDKRRYMGVERKEPSVLIPLAAVLDTSL